MESATLTVRSATIATGALLLCGGGLRLCWMAAAGALEAVQASGPDAPDDLIVFGAAAGSAVILAWLGLGVMLAARTADIAEEWRGSPVPYLRSVSDPYDYLSPHHNWRLTFTTADAQRRLGSPPRWFGASQRFSSGQRSRRPRHPSPTPPSRSHSRPGTPRPASPWRRRRRIPDSASPRAHGSLTAGPPTPAVPFLRRRP